MRRSGGHAHSHARDGRCSPRSRAPSRRCPCRRRRPGRHSDGARSRRRRGRSAGSPPRAYRTPSASARVQDDQGPAGGSCCPRRRSRTTRQSQDAWSVLRARSSRCCALSSLALACSRSSRDASSKSLDRRTSSRASGSMGTPAVHSQCRRMGTCSSCLAPGNRTMLLTPHLGLRVDADGAVKWRSPRSGPGGARCQTSPRCQIHRSAAGAVARFSMESWSCGIVASGSTFGVPASSRRTTESGNPGCSAGRATS
jgi:hypothetical protein